MGANGGGKWKHPGEQGDLSVCKNPCHSITAEQQLPGENRASLQGLQAFHELHLPSRGMQQPGASAKRQQDPCTRCPALISQPLKG